MKQVKFLRGIVRLGLAGALVAAAALSASAERGLNLSAMDTRVKPCEDFFKYANGNWLDHAIIPADKTGDGVWTEVGEHNLSVLHDVAGAAAADKAEAPTSPRGKVGSFYRSGMDEAQIEKDGLKPLAAEFARIDAIQTVPALEAEIGHLHRLSIPVAFSFSVAQDDKDSAQQIAMLSQGGLDLPERGYYFRPDAETSGIRSAFSAHMTTMFGFLGETPTKAELDAQVVMALETRLALASKTPTEQRDPLANYHKMTLPELNALAPGTNWQPYFTALGLSNPGGMDVTQPQFFVALSPLLSQTPLTDWKTYLRWGLLSAEAPRLSKAIVAEDFHFTHTVLNGVPENQPRWKRVLGATDASLGDALGQLYIARAFSPLARAQVLGMVHNLQFALKARIRTLDWMAPNTKIQALAKMDTMAAKVGYPDHWRDYSRLDVSSPSYVVNGVHADEFEFQRDLDKIGKPVDRSEWGMTPPTVNAYYSDEMNDINFPAGILQPPFFQPQYDDAVNYGDTGATIGHEMTHGFDDQGRQYDAQGNLHDWWTAADAKDFDTRAQGIVAQYSAYEPLPGVHINGSLTQGENIADIGGLKIAYLAFERAIQGKPRPKIDGFTPEQRFFIAYAQSWRIKERPEAVKVSLLSDPHSPPAFRVNGTVANLPEFRQAFGCPPDPKASPTAIW